jgi:hypothetical protein
VPCVPMEQCDVSFATDVTWTPALILVGPSLNDFGGGSYHYDYTRTAHSTTEMFTGGKGIPHRQSVVELYMWASEFKNNSYAGCGAAGDQLIPASQTIVSDLGHLNDDYTLYAALGPGITKDITVQAPPRRYNVANVDGGRHDLVTTCRAMTPSDRERTVLGVAEQVDMKFQPTIVYSQPFWTCTAGSVSPKYPTFANQTLYTACSNAAKADVFAWFKRPDGNYGALTKTTFTTVEPTGIDHTELISTKSDIPRGVSGAGMHIRPFLKPTNVSFYRIECWETGRDASNVTGYYTRWTPAYLGHTTARGANAWFPINEDNSWQEPWDNAYWYGDEPFGSPPKWDNGGGFTWVIPGRWRTGPRTVDEHDLKESWDQTFSISSSGTMTIKKLGHTVTRTTDNVYTTAN